jgi:hypothetical protein
VLPELVLLPLLTLEPELGAAGAAEATADEAGASLEAAAEVTGAELGTVDMVVMLIGAELATAEL